MPGAGADRRGLKIALMGGSFNPAHQGHLDIALFALARLRVDEVWWLVAPQNPLKPVAGMAPYPARLASARAMARHPRIVVKNVERRLATAYTADTIAALRARCPGTRFVWVMGADNLAAFHRWERWQQIFNSVAVAVFDRPTYSLRALSGQAARRFRKSRLPERAGKTLPGRRAPAWVFFHTPLNPMSATRIREQRSRP